MANGQGISRFLLIFFEFSAGGFPVTGYSFPFLIPLPGAFYSYRSGARLAAQRDGTIGNRWNGLELLNLEPPQGFERSKAVERLERFERAPFA
jgi:hypothetical protein